MPFYTDSENPIYNDTEDPFSPGAFSAITLREPEQYQVSGSIPEHPGMYGFQLQDRPAIGTLQIYEFDTDLPDTDSEKKQYEIITSGSPNASQVQVDLVTGWCRFHVDNSGKEMVTEYDSYGSANSKENINKLIDKRLRDLGLI